MRQGLCNIYNSQNGHIWCNYFPVVSFMISKDDKKYIFELENAKINQYVYSGILNNKFNFFQIIDFFSFLYLVFYFFYLIIN